MDTPPQAPPSATEYLRLVGIAALIGVPSALAAALFLALIHALEDWLWTELPASLGYAAPPEDWPADNEWIRFVHDGVESAIAQAQEAAGGKTVALATPTVTRAAYAAGLLDGLSVNLVPVLLGEGIPWFAGISDDPVALEGPRIVAGNGVTHLNYGVAR